MKLTAFLNLLVLVVLGLGAAPDTAAIDVAWMQQGVRVWYFGGVSTGGSSDAEEAYLFKAIAGTSAQLTHYSALNHWKSPQPTDTQTYSLVNQGSVWIHPQVLQSIQIGDSWLQQQITDVVRSTYTWETFRQLMPNKQLLLPANALFDVKSPREIVKLTFMIAQYSIGNAYFDSETGILLYHDNVGGGVEVFFMLAEINYDFAQHTAFAEDDGPHAGFHSWASEASLGNGLGVGGGAVDIHSQVESRYGPNIEMWVNTTLTGPSLSKPTSYENYAFFGGVPVVKRINHDQAGSIRPELWSPFGQYLWWWLPSTATGAVAAASSYALDALSTINVFDVPMTKTADFPLTYTYTGTEIPQRFFFSSIQFGNDGYMTVFSAKDPTIGLDVKPGDFIFQNYTVVDGPAYFRKSMIDDDFPPGGQGPAGWITTPGANAGWLVASDSSYEGPYSLKSADVGDSQTAGIQVSGTYPAGNVSFAVRVSSESDQDFFAFVVDDVLKLYGSGEIAWTTVSVPIDAGPHKLAWLYLKNGSVSSGNDAAWIDTVVLPKGGVSAPAATTDSASGITAAAATLNGTVSSNGASTTVTFDYGQTTAYGHGATAAQSPLAAGASNAPVSAAIAALTCNMLYHFRVVAVNSVNTTNGDDATFTTAPCPSLDIDASISATKYDALTDGLLTVRYLSGLTSTALTTGATGNTATRTDPAAIKAYLDGMRPALDIDGNGTADALTDGLLIIRYLFGLRGDALIAGAIDPLAPRKTAPEIEAYIQSLMP